MYRWLTIAGAIVLIPLVIVLGVVTLRDNGASSAEEDELPAVLTVDGYQVTEREYRLKVDAAKSNVHYMEGVAATDSPHAGFMDAYADLIRETGPDNVALAVVIADAAVYQWGIDHGLEVNDEELDAALDEQREIVATADDPSVQERRDFIAEVGDDNFWNEIMPRVLSYELMTEKVRKDQVDASQSADEKQADWESFQRQVVLDATVEILDPSLISQAMIDGAVQYLTEDYPAFQAEHPQQ